MTHAVPSTTVQNRRDPAPIRITPELFLAAARRLVSQAQADVEAAAERLVASAPTHGIDLGLVHATVDSDQGRPRVRQACLPVLGAGRTAMIFVSEPMKHGDPGGEKGARAERAACVDATCQFLGRTMAGQVCVAQGLPDPRERWGVSALLDSGFSEVGHLSYMRRPIMDRTGVRTLETDWPTGVEVIPLARIEPSRWDGLLIDALNRTYESTLDCPDLCGLRTTQDILESHKATGEFDPTTWWIVLLNGEGHGCLLLTRCPEQRTLELVYIGLSPSLRGKGLSHSLLSMGIQSCRKSCQGWSVACAVDLRNAPALKIYGRLGFRAFAERLAIVRALSPLARPV